MPYLNFVPIIQKEFENSRKKFNFFLNNFQYSLFYSFNKSNTTTYDSTFGNFEHLHTPIYRQYFQEKYSDNIKFQTGRYKML